MLRPPLRWTERLAARYGDTFQVRLLGPSYQADHSWRALLPRTIVVLSRPEHLRELFSRSRDEFLAGQAYEFLSWHVGDDAIMVLDGAAHRRERHELQAIVHHPGILDAYERATRDSLRRSFASWPDQGTLELQPGITRAVLDAGLRCIFGALSPAELTRLRELAVQGAAANAVPTAITLLPWLRRAQGRYGGAGRVRRAIARFDEFVGQRLADPPVGGCMLDVFRTPATGSLSGEESRRIAQRIRLGMAGFWATGVAAVWLCYHVVRDPAAFERVREAALREDLSGTAYLDAACREALRLNLPFRGAFRRVARSTSLAGIALGEGTLILPHYGLTHRRPDLYPEPLRFRPERFLERSFAPEEFAPFGGGSRRCTGEQLALLQLRLLLTELVRAFELRPARPWRTVERRRAVMILPQDPLPAVLRRRKRPA